MFAEVRASRLGGQQISILLWREIEVAVNLIALNLRYSNLL